MKRTSKELVDEAYAEVETFSVEDALKMVGDDSIQLIDLRDIRELWREGTIPGAYHAPRGMLEFWVDTESPYHKEVFSSGKKLVFFCAAGWRSALAAKVAQDMGVEPVAHIHGGFTEWKNLNGPIEEKKQPAPK